MKKYILLLLIFILITNIAYASTNNILKAKIVDTNNTSIDSTDYQLLDVVILDKPYKNKTLNIKHLIIDYSANNQHFNIGDTLLVEVSNTNGILMGTIVDTWRLDSLKKLSIIFVILLIIFGRLKGIRSLLALIFSGYIIIKLLIPYIIKGYNSILCAVICSSIIIIISFLLISGFTKKTLVSILGTIGGTISAGILSLIFTNLSNITGLAEDEAVFLAANMGLEVDFKGLYLCAVIIGTIGVIMDVSMSITSVIFEIKRKSPRIPFTDLLHSGLNVGKDVMSTMINTLILAYAGSFLPLLLIFIMSKTPFLNALNTELLAVEVIRALCGSIGLILTIPLTALIATYVAFRNTAHNNYLYN
ncbi:YibE/F family protein [Abyssisolibacter fermentans]|uniref:YibE/F family protein n=1 Tax=Abyssisolibacter fermentans TaxID=1766203 RepID=UPI00083033E1|nr:YibE/F family protein [Abyssisolibacter fermentans]